MLNIIFPIKRTQVHCTQILSTLFTCLHAMINTDVTEQPLQPQNQNITEIFSLADIFQIAVAISHQVVVLLFLLCFFF